MKKIHLRFSDAPTFTSKLIKLWTGCWCSHVEFVVGIDKFLGSDIVTGVALVGDEYYDNNPINREKFYSIIVTDTQYDIVLRSANNELGKKYDLLALLGNVVRRDWENPEKWFCSELVAHCFKVADHPLLNYDTNRITPLDLLKSPIVVECTKEEAYDTKV